MASILCTWRPSLSLIMSMSSAFSHDQKEAKLMDIHLLPHYHKESLAFKHHLSYVLIHNLSHQQAPNALPANHNLGRFPRPHKHPGTLEEPVPIIRIPS